MLCSWEGNRGSACWKVMAAYCQVYDFSHLLADCPGPGSTPVPYACKGIWDYLCTYHLRSFVGSSKGRTYCIVRMEVCRCRYGDVHPEFFIGSLDEALRDALQCKARDVSSLSPFQRPFFRVNLG